MSKTILTLTVNPAVDRIVTADRLVFEDRAYILSTTEAAGGRGVNAARVLTNLEATVIAITPSGGDGGRKFEELLQSDSFSKEIVKTRKGIRTNLTITDRQGLSIKLNELGHPLTQPELNRIFKAVEKHLPVASWLMLCGSIPPGVDPHFFAKLIKLAAKHEVQTLLDTDGDALLYGVEAEPTIVKPNQSEAERLLNRALITRSNSIDAVKRIKAMGAKYVVLSLGSRGIIAASPEEILEVIPPRVEALSPIGAGDAAAAAIVWAMDRGEPFREALRWGVSAGTASSMLPGISLASFDQIKEIYPQTQVNKIS